MAKLGTVKIVRQLPDGTQKTCVSILRSGNGYDPWFTVGKDWFIWPNNTKTGTPVLYRLGRVATMTATRQSVL